MPQASQEHRDKLPTPAPLKILLPLPPSINACYADVIRYDRFRKPYVQRVPTKALVAFKRQATRALVAQCIPRGTWAGVPAVKCTVRIYVPDRHSDRDNRGKAWKDVVFPWIGLNDNRDEEAHEYRRLDADHPRIQIELEAIRQALQGEL